MRDQNASSTLKVKDAVVNVENVLENINHELLQVGAWVNIIGTLRLLDGEPRKRHGKSRRSKPIVSLAVDATMIWSAGAIKLDEYRSAVEAYRKPLAPG